MQVLFAALTILLATASISAVAQEPTLVLDPRTAVPSGKFSYEVMDALRPVTANLIRQMDECFARGRGGAPMRIRVLVALDENGKVTDVQPHPEMPMGEEPQLEEAMTAVSECGPFDNGGRPDVYRLLDMVLVDAGS